MSVKPRIHDATRCTTGCTAGCTTGCIVYTQLYIHRYHLTHTVFFYFSSYLRELYRRNSVLLMTSSKRYYLLRRFHFHQVVCDVGQFTKGACNIYSRVENDTKIILLNVKIVQSFTVEYRNARFYGPPCVIVCACCAVRECASAFSAHSCTCRVFLRSIIHVL